MTNKDLIAYIQNYSTQGYDIYTIRNQLIQYGYSQKDIDDAIAYIYSQKEVKHIHLSRSSVIVLIFFFIGVAIMVSSILIYISPEKKEEQPLLDLELSKITTDIEAGKPFEFNIVILNVGHKEKFDVHLKHSVVNKNDNQLLTSTEEELGITTRISKKSKIQIPENADFGEYTLETIANYKDKTAQASFVFNIIGKSVDSCSNGIKDSNEEGIDCGGSCKPCTIKECPSCDDNNFCTNDFCNETTNFECKHEVIELCCGNGFCEKTEDLNSCPSDCKINKTQDIGEGELQKKINEIIELSKTKPENAINLCARFESIERDLCFNQIALVINDNSFCMKIEDIVKKDSCIMNIAINTNNYQNCDAISNENLKTSCKLLAGR